MLEKILMEAVIFQFMYHLLAPGSDSLVVWVQWLELMLRHKLDVASCIKAFSHRCSLCDKFLLKNRCSVLHF